MHQQIMANCVSHPLLFHCELSFCEQSNFEGVYLLLSNFKFVVQSSRSMSDSNEFDGV